MFSCFFHPLFPGFALVTKPHSFLFELKYVVIVSRNELCVLDVVFEEPWLCVFFALAFLCCLLGYCVVSLLPSKFLRFCKQKRNYRGRSIVEGEKGKYLSLRLFECVSEAFCTGDDVVYLEPVRTRERVWLMREELGSGWIILDESPWCVLYIQIGL